jgi:hypothetical protein
MSDLALLERFVCGVAYGQQTAGGCLPWGGKPSASGYGVIGHDWKVRPAHRVAYELFIGSIPAGYEIDHLCRNRMCVEPTHLEPVTKLENRRRSAANGMALFQYKCQNPDHHRVPRSGRENGTRCYECNRDGHTKRARVKRAKRKEQG